MAKMKKKSIQEKKPEKANEMVDRHIDDGYTNKLGDLLQSRDESTLSELVELRDRLTKGK